MLKPLIFKLLKFAQGKLGVSPQLAILNPQLPQISASESSTLDPLSLTGTVTVDVQATLAATLAPLTVVGLATVGVAGSDVESLDPLTVAGTAKVDVAASASSTLAPLTVAASGTVAIASSLAATLGALTVVATGKIDVAAALASVLGNLSVAGSGTVGVAGSEVESLDPLTVAGSGTVAIAASLAKTLDELIVDGHGIVGALPISISLNSQLDPVTLSASATVSDPVAAPVEAAMVRTKRKKEAPKKLPVIQAKLTATLDGVTVHARGSVGVAAQMTASLGALTVRASAIVEAPAPVTELVLRAEPPVPVLTNEPTRARVGANLSPALATVANEAFAAAVDARAARRRKDEDELFGLLEAA